MAAVKGKFYTVWVGVEPGVYDSWSEAQLQVLNFPGARFKSFKTREEAIEAYRGDPQEHLGLIKSILGNPRGESVLCAQRKVPESTECATIRSFPTSVSMPLLSMERAPVIRDAWSTEP